MFKGTILIIVKEAGAAAYLAALMKGTQTGRITIYAYPKAADVFAREHIPFFAIHRRLSAAAVVKTINPDIIYVSLSVGPTFEKRVLTEGKRNGIPVYVFLDSYLNLWQRFADHRGIRKWHYLPDRIYVIDTRTKERIVRQGAPKGIIRILPHPLITRQRFKKERPAISREQLLGKLGLPEKAGLILFVSEYRFRDSKIWKWDQPARGDLERLLTISVNAASAISKEHHLPTFVLVKKHPMEKTDVKRTISPALQKFCRTVDQFDKVSLISAADIVTGLTSILLSEAVSYGKTVFSHHHHKSDKSAWFSTINPKILEMASERACLTLIKDTLLEGRNGRGGRHR